MTFKIVVAAKKVIDFTVKIRLKPDGSGVETNNVKTSMNPFDEIAVEEAVLLKEQGIAEELLLITIGDTDCAQVLRQGLAMGMDRALHIQTDRQLEPINVAKVLQTLIVKEQPHLVILGKQAIDDDCNQTGQMLAALLNWPQGTFASKLQIQGQTAQVTREVDGGLETVELTLPAVVTTDLRLNHPRFPTLPNIMKVKKKPIETQTLQRLGLDLSPHMIIKTIQAPPPRKPGVKVNTVQELVAKLHQEAKVI